MMDVHVFRRREAPDVPLSATRLPVYFPEEGRRRSVVMLAGASVIRLGRLGFRRVLLAQEYAENEIDRDNEILGCQV
jgi:hypothetical protein